MSHGRYSSARVNSTSPNHRSGWRRRWPCRVEWRRRFNRFFPGTVLHLPVEGSESDGATHCRRSSEETEEGSLETKCRRLGSTFKTWFLYCFLLSQIRRAEDNKASKCHCDRPSAKVRKSSSNLQSIEIYDANRIAVWVNAHPPVALWLASLGRQRSLAGFRSHEAWGKADDIKTIPWIADDNSRFSHNRIEDSKLKLHGPANVWTFQEAAAAALDWLATDQAVLRIAGPSGFGKSRFAYEMFNQQANVSGEADRTIVIYADLVIVGDEVAKLALEIADAGSSAILVVDDCPDEFHSKLADITRRAGSRLRLVTIDVETKVQDTLVIRLEPASDRTIGSIASAVSPTVSDSDSRYIQEFAKGFPRMAVLAARQNGVGRQAIRSAEQVLDRVVWGRNPRDRENTKSTRGP
jgi:hypothetical protein